MLPLYAVRRCSLPCAERNAWGIGGADIKLSTAAALLLGFYKGVIGFMLGLLIAVVAQLIMTHRKKEQRTQPFALLPYLSVGLWIGFLI